MNPHLCSCIFRLSGTLKTNQCVLLHSFTVISFMATMGIAPLQDLMKEDFKNIGKNNEVRSFHSAGNGSLQFSSREKAVNLFYEYWTLSYTKQRVTPSPHQPCCKLCKHIVKNEWWVWLLFLLHQDPSCHELQWFENGGSLVFVAELGMKFFWFLSTETSSKGKYKTVREIICHQDTKICLRSELRLNIIP